MKVTDTAGFTDPGRKRRRNEDSFVIDPPLFAVADGMGGAQAGEVASRLAAAAFREFHDADDLDPEERLAAIIQEANRRIYERAAGDAQVSGMGTTITAALVVADALVIGHVGDSRAYRLRGGKFEQLTDDHSLVADLVRSGRITPEEADAHPQRSVITRALGTDSEVDVDTFTVQAASDDLFLICSDGLTTMVDDEEIRDLVTRARDLEQAGKGLVKAANKAGGEDNITVVLFRVAAGPSELEDTVVASGNGRGQDEDLEDTLTGLEAPTIAAPAPAAAAVAEREWGPALDEEEPPPRPSPTPAGEPALGPPRGACRARAGLRGRDLRGGVLGAHASELHRRERGRGRRGVPGPAVGSRRRRPPLPAAVREPAPGRAAHALRARGPPRPQALLLRLRPRPARPVRTGSVALALTLRNRELVNLLLVGLLTAAGFTAVYIARQDVVSAGSLSYAAFFLAVFVAAHVILRFALPNADPFLLPVGGLLTAVGLTMIYRIDPDLALRQGLWVVVGLAAFALLVVFLRDYRLLDRYKYILGLTAIFLLALPAVPGLGRTINGANLWVGVGGLVFQPGEFAKVLLVIFLAGYLRDNREMLSMGTGRFGMPSLKHFGPLLVIWGGAMLVLFQTNDLGGGLLYFSIFLAMLWVATARWQYVVVGLGLFAAGAYALYHVTPHVRERVSIWLDCSWTFSSACPVYDQGYQLAQSIYAISGGGFFGQGLGRGVLLTAEGNTYIPYLETDFIYAGIAQELGLAGAAGLVLVYVVFCYRGFKIALQASDGFSKLLAVGLTAAIGIQAFIIMGGVSGLIPLTGITLPFVSYGGSSIVANFGILALLLMISDRVNRERS